MKSISIYKLNFRRPIDLKIVCYGFGRTHKHYFIFLSLAELSTALSTLSVFGFDSIKVFKQDANGNYSISVEL